MKQAKIRNFLKNPTIAILSCVSGCVVSRHDHCTIYCTGRTNCFTVNRRSFWQPCEAEGWALA